MPPHATRAALVAYTGFTGLPDEPLLVAWDDRRSIVRLRNGELKWYIDGTHQAYPREAEIVVEDVAGHVFPRGNRYMDAFAVRSLDDLVDTVNAEEITSVDDAGTIHFHGEHDNSRGQAVRAEDTGIILSASGVEGRRSWRLEVITSRLLEGDTLLRPADVSSPQV